MSSGFLSNFMRVAQSVTRADRSMALDLEMNIHDRANITDAQMEEANFTNLLSNTVTEAIAQGSAVITNNLITDPKEAPNTNVHLHDLRLIVAIPLSGYGAIYLDQHIRQGVFERGMIDKLSTFGNYLIENDKTDLGEEDLLSLYREM